MYIYMDSSGSCPPSAIEESAGPNPNPFGLCGYIKVASFPKKIRLTDKSSSPLNKLSITGITRIHSSISAQPFLCLKSNKDNPNQKMPSLLSLLVPVSLFFTSVSSLTRLEDQSFYAPFTEYDSGGSRMVASYREGGVAKVNENFIRLTPDRQSKRGHIWSSRRVDVHDWSVVLEFRVSGQGKTLFGDGLAFWFTDMPNIRNGEVFGVVDDFKGFAVVFDTFRNQEFLNVHKDISVLTGDGKPGAGDRRNTERPGCDADFRCVYCCCGCFVGSWLLWCLFLDSISPSSRHVFVLSL